MYSRSIIYLVAAAVPLLFHPAFASGQTSQSTVLASMDHSSSLNLSEGSPQVVQNGPRGNDVLQVDRSGEARIEL